MPGGGPSPAETTLPLALKWPAPPTRPHRSLSPPPGSPGAPPGWRRVPRTTGYPPPGPAQPPRPQPTFTPTPARPPGAPSSAASRAPGSRPGRARATPGRAPAPTQRSSLVRSSAGMAVGTLVSRGTGFLRTLVLVYAVGTGPLGNAYNNANTLPNTVYYLMLGGIFTSVVVPLLVRAARRDPDRGEAYAQRMFTLGAVALLVVTVLATLLAAPLVHLYAPTIHGPPGTPLGAEHNLMVVWAYFFIPQIFFYGMSSLIGAILNTRGRFAAPMWTPVINNLVVIVFGGLYVVTVGLNKDPRNIPAAGVQLLGIGTTLGVVAQTVALFPSLRAAGFRWRPTLGFRPGEVTEMGRMAGWMSVYVITQWAGNLVVQIRRERGLGRPERLLGVLHRLAAVPAAVRDRRHLGDHGAAAPDERARERAAVLAGQGRLLDRRPAGLGDRRPGGDLPLRARRPDGRVLCSPTAAPPRRTPGTSARSSACSPSAWCPTCSPSCSCGSSTRSRTAGPPPSSACSPCAFSIAASAHRQVPAARRPGGRRAGRRVRSREPGRDDRRLGAAAAPGRQPGRAGDRPQPDPDAPGHRARGSSSRSP